MKKMLLSGISCLLMAALAQAQISKGSIMLGGSITGGSSKQGLAQELKQNSIGIAPTVGIAIKENTIAGVELFYGNNTTKQSPNKVDNDNYGAGVFVRKYLSLGRSFYLFGQPGIFFNHARTRYISNTSLGKSLSTGITARFYPGISFAATKRFHLECGLPNLVQVGLSRNKNYDAADVLTDKSTSMNFSVSASSFSAISFGFRVFLTKQPG
ncbi:MAG TPA: hypothetical protein VFR58_01245 [Flavisolibacter sp.]|nr:hypothetical protein [Flavisolibacter sp.]